MILLNPVVISVIVMIGLCLINLNIVLALLLAALAAAWAATSVDITVFRKPFGVFLLWAGANMLLQKKK